jgi:hypothetical protein
MKSLRLYPVNGELHNLNSSPALRIIGLIKSRRMRWAEHVTGMRKKTNIYRILVGKQEGNRTPGVPKRRRVDNNEMELKEISWGGRTGLI